ncbi:hypothetical protein HHK36_022020 [Tetracentron sinense]|uniref:PGG domain-containing protein n=1 Tax=Tetracentron sinense TaxID=13715 RepID=A0A835D6G7_TETSI|nr:hypothetical protein HHK36_022020 [Tetracentron sinense]
MKRKPVKKHPHGESLVSLFSLGDVSDMDPRKVVAKIDGGELSQVNQVYKLLMKADAKRGIGKGFEEVTNPNRMVDEYNTRTKGMNKTQMVVATLIATVTFAAAFQVPGGYDKDGTATLAKEAAFQVFVVTDAIALSCSVTAVFLSFILPLLRDRWPLKLIKFVAILTLIAVVAMLVAFAAGLYVVLTDSLWLGISTCSIVFGLSSILVLFCKIFLNSDRRSDAKALNNSKSDDPKSDAS